MSKYNELQDLTALYEEKRFLLNNESRRFGHAIIDGFPSYLGCEKNRVKGLPPKGPADTDACFR